MEKFILLFESRLTRWGIYVISIPLILMAAIETLNALGRKLLVPLPCAIESVESLMVITIYFGVSVVAQEGGHVEVDLVSRSFPPRIQNLLTIFSNLLGALTFGFLTCGAWIDAWNSTKILEMRMGVYRFPVWPFKLLFAFGLTLLTVQLILNAIKLVNVGRGNTSYANVDKSTAEPDRKLGL